MNTADVCIVGAGFSGLYLASLLSRTCTVLVLDRKRNVGEPPHCTGLVSLRTIKRIGKVALETIESKYHEIHFIDLDNKETILIAKLQEEVYKLNRIALEKLLATQAINNGAQFKFKSKVIEVEIEGRIKLCRDTIKCRLIVIAEGSTQLLTKKLGLGYVKDRIVGIQHYIPKESKAENEKFYVLIGNHIDSEFFGWAVPVKNLVLIGIGGKYGKVRITELKKLTNKLVKLRIARKAELGNVFGGIILRGPPLSRVSKGRIIVIGDASGYTKPVTGGGLDPISRQINILHEIIRYNDVENVPLLYEGKIKNLYKELSKSRIIHTILKYIGYTQAVRFASRFLGKEIHISDYDNHLRALVSLFSEVFK